MRFSVSDPTLIVTETDMSWWTLKGDISAFLRDSTAQLMSFQQNLILKLTD